MADIVVTVPKSFTHPCAPGLKGLAAWVAEGDAAGDEWSGREWEFTVAGSRPPVHRGERVYIVCDGKLRGYSPLIRIETIDHRYWGLIRGGEAVAVTINERMIGFRGWRYRWWSRESERPFANWRDP